MRIIELKNKYHSKIYILDSQKLIYKLDCGCMDFQMRRIKKHGKNADKKLFYSPCKHLKEPVKRLINQGYNLKKPKKSGPNKLKVKIKNKIIERSNNKCEMCGRPAKCFHRIVRGSNGGKYNFENIKHLCLECHKKVHANEF